jgi:nucleoside-triphosphatase THEP1
MQAQRHLPLTGTPGSGKTTVIRKVAEQLADERPGGFYTEKIRTAGERSGFRLVGFGGVAAVLAHVDFDCRVAREHRSTPQTVKHHGRGLTPMREVCVKPEPRHAPI